ncbi:MAG: ATP-binding domain-containing protein [Clostridia bacterium]|nr:ATP-binding domain-containing protein [Clostridia bacterium]
MELIDELSDGHSNLMIVGDPDQNIYEWRGSDVKLLVDFDKTHPGTKTVFLNRNYRSTPQILKCANTLIDKNKYRLKKDLFTLVDSGIEVVHFHAKNDYEEADRIIERIREIKKGGAKYSDFAVLYRSGFLSRIIEKKFTECGLPYEIYGGVKFYLRMEIQDVMAYLKLIAFDGDKPFKRIVNTPKRKFGRAKMQRLTELRRDGETLYETLRENLDDGVIKNSKAHELVETVENMRSYAADHGIAEIVEKVCADTGYEAYIRELGDMERFENLAEFKRIASEYEKNYGESVSLRDFINQLSLQMSDSEAEDPDRVKLMTIHAAKGLEFPTVFILGFSEGIFPSSKTIEERKELGLEEERRLCYVAITRAEKRLYLLDSEGASQNGSPKMPSRFLFEIGEDNYRRIGTISKELKSGMIKAASASFEESEVSEMKSAGDEVEHPAFGKGQILHYDKTRNNYVIQFDGLGSTRTISADFFSKTHSLPVLKPKHEEEKTGDVKTISEIKEKEEPDRKYLVKENKEKAVPSYDRNAPSEPEGFEAEEEIKVPIQEKRISTSEQKSIEEAPLERSAAPVREKKDRVNLWECEDVPKTGWMCVGVTDLGAPVGVCDMCGQDPIRYVHHMVHHAYRPLGVGCVCAGKMEGDPERAKQRERDFKNSQARRENFMNRRWKVSRNNNEYLKIKEHLIVLYKNRESGKWKYSFDNAFAPEIFNTREEAVSAAFEALEKATGQRK